MSVEICLPETKKRKIEIEKESKLASVQIVTPGEVISSNINDGGFMRFYFFILILLFFLKKKNMMI